MKFAATFLITSMLSAKAVHCNMLNVDVSLEHDLCGKQSDKVKFDITKMDGETCGDGACYYQICLEINDDTSLLDLVKDPLNKLTHTCVKSDSVCQTGQDDGFLGVSSEVSTAMLGVDLFVGFKQCQMVLGGSIAEFLLGDGIDGNCGTSVLEVVKDTVASCANLDVSSCVGLNGVGLGTECVWRVEAPPCDDNKQGGGGGDPHIARWGQEHDSFHGECDLVLLRNEDFHNGMGLELHARTTIQSYFSYIETAALRVGDTILEFYRDHVLVNGETFFVTDLPLTLGSEGFAFTLATLDTKKNPKYNQDYIVDLNESSSITFHFYKQFMTFSVSGSPSDFGTGKTTGLLGDYHTGAMIARDGSSIFKDFVDFAFEWQVDPSREDGQLFSQAREPQLPYEKCRMPTAPRPSRRHLRTAGNTQLLAQAQTACAHVGNNNQNKKSYDLCIDDILTTGDVGLATAW